MHVVQGKVGFLVLTSLLSLANRFHQYYVSGETADCSLWKENFADCELWVDRCCIVLHRFIGHVQGGQGGSAQGDRQGEGLSEVIMIDFAIMIVLKP